MIVVKLQGGLGNQMFQYACAKSLSLKTNAPLLIDDSFLQQNNVATTEFTPRVYALDIFDNDLTKASETLVRSFQDASPSGKARKLLGLPYKKKITERVELGSTQLAGIRPPVYLDGYWQSAEYFAGYEDDIRRFFTFSGESILPKDPSEHENIDHTLVSIHFRRGDYVSNPVASQVLGALGMDYYIAAIKQMQSKVVRPFFWIFSDDRDWVVENLQTDAEYCLLEEQPAGRHWADMQLMSLCKHHIIANSSFSWWGAWLNPDPEKIVIAPKQWFADHSLNKAATGIVPEDWIRL